MIRAGEPVFVDSGAWIALALTKDPHHERARSAWDTLGSVGASLRTSVPVVLETFTFLDRNAVRDVALLWRDSLEELSRFEILECTLRDLDLAWSWFRGKDIHALSAVDATSFAIMKRAGIRLAFAFDHHFAVAGFQLVG